ncbi:MAG: hypothetical protein A2Z88_11610 [Omnitrophica WOR_2 bacterium GWA2_47_8]|nr:MAG: hypothetical protein A2Z88_11610 [Omnitrophica WOR_2 bacterium GWA2_47_8]
MRKAVFLDRDGVINENVDDLISPDQFRMFPEAPKAILSLHEAGYLIIVVTNQPSIAKGFCTMDDIKRIHKKMEKELLREGARVDAIYVCPHHPEKGHSGEIKELKIDCDCRKPKPGLLLGAMREHDIDPKKSYMVGDSLSDIAAGKEAGCVTILLKKGGGAKTVHKKMTIHMPDFTVHDLTEAASVILKKSS